MVIQIWYLDFYERRKHIAERIKKCSEEIGDVLLFNKQIFCLVTDMIDNKSSEMRSSREWHGKQAVSIYNSDWTYGEPVIN